MLSVVVWISSCRLVAENHFFVVLGTFRQTSSFKFCKCVTCMCVLFWLSCLIWMNNDSFFNGASFSTICVCTCELLQLVCPVVCLFRRATFPKKCLNIAGTLQMQMHKCCVSAHIIRNGFVFSHHKTQSNLCYRQSTAFVPKVSTHITPTCHCMCPLSGGVCVRHIACAVNAPAMPVSDGLSFLYRTVLFAYFDCKSYIHVQNWREINVLK